MHGETEVVIDEKIVQDNKIPGKYNVVMLNDDITPIDWVINILKSVFKHSDSNAEQITLKIHNEGSAVVGTYHYEIAEQKAIETTNLSRDQGFPLQVRIDESS